MERTLLKMGDEWSPFQKLPTNMLQLMFDYFPITQSRQYANHTLIHEILRQHEQLIGAAEGGLNMGMIYQHLGMVSDRTIRR